MGKRIKMIQIFRPLISAYYNDSPPLFEISKTQITCTMTSECSDTIRMLDAYKLDQAWAETTNASAWHACHTRQK